MWIDKYKQQQQQQQQIEYNWFGYNLFFKNDTNWWLLLTFEAMESFSKIKRLLEQHESVNHTKTPLLVFAENPKATRIVSGRRPDCRKMTAHCISLWALPEGKSFVFIKRMHENRHTTGMGPIIPHFKKEHCSMLSEPKSVVGPWLGEFCRGVLATICSGSQSKQLR